MTGRYGVGGSVVGRATGYRSTKAWRSASAEPNPQRVATRANGRELNAICHTAASVRAAQT